MVKNLPANAGDEGNVRDVGLTPGAGRSPGGGNGTHSSILASKEGAWQATVHGVAKSQMQMKQLSTHSVLPADGSPFAVG